MNIYVGSLHYDIGEATLKQVFEEFGQVESVKIITDKFSGRSKGFGFIEMPNDDEAKVAIEALNGKDLQGRAIVVSQSQGRKEGEGGDRRFNQKRKSFGRRDNYRRDD